MTAGRTWVFAAVTVRDLSEIVRWRQLRGKRHVWREHGWWHIGPAEPQKERSDA